MEYSYIVIVVITVALIVMMALFLFRPKRKNSSLVVKARTDENTFQKKDVVNSFSRFTEIDIPERKQIEKAVFENVFYECKTIIDAFPIIDYNHPLFVDYNLPSATKKEYPYLVSPQYGTEIKFPVEGRNSLRGASEIQFTQTASNNSAFFYDKLTLFCSGRKYEPDLCYIDSLKNIFIDIEIDEPYDGAKKEPIHYLRADSTRLDEQRDFNFQQRGWIVIRFSEKQIVETPLSCLKYIFQMIKKIDPMVNILREIQDAPNIVSENMWTSDKAKMMQKERIREKYLGIIEFKSRENRSSSTSLLEDYKNGAKLELSLVRKQQKPEVKIVSKISEKEISKPAAITTKKNVPSTPSPRAYA